VGNRLLGVLLLALAVAGVVFAGDRVQSQRVLVVRAGTENAAGATDTTVVPGPDGAAAPGPGSTPAPAPGTAPSTTTSAPGGNTTSTAAGPGDQALAQQMVLRPDDLPSGFSQQPAGAPRSGASGGEDAFDSCLGSDTAALRRALKVRARSPHFSRRPANAVSSAAALLDTPASAVRMMAVLKTDAARECLEKQANDRLADDPGFPEGSSGRMSRIALGAFGEESRAYRLEVHIPSEDPGGKEATYLADFLFMRKGRAVVMVQFGSLNGPFNLAEAQAVAGRLAARM
jgi:hypothetical protein